MSPGKFTQKHAKFNDEKKRKNKDMNQKKETKLRRLKLKQEKSKALSKLIIFFLKKIFTGTAESDFGQIKFIFG